MLYMNNYLKTKELKTFQVVPQKTSFIPEYMYINSNVLKTISRQISNENKSQNKSGLDDKEEEEEEDEDNKSNTNRKLWLKFFDMERFETKNSKFSLLIKTDGIGVCIHMHKINAETGKQITQKGKKKKAAKPSEVEQKYNLSNYLLSKEDECAHRH